MTDYAHSELADIEPGLTDLAQRIRAVKGTPISDQAIRKFAIDLNRLAAELTDVAKSLSS